MGWLATLFGTEGLGIAELSRRLDIDEATLLSFKPTYRQFMLPKSHGGTRIILAPDDATKNLQRRVLRRLLNRLAAHPTVHGYERGRSIVTNAASHTEKEIVAKIDLVDFFPTTRAHRITDYFRAIGWNRRTSKLLTRLVTHNGGLPQGAPTSPRLSNLVNFLMDQRLSALAASVGAVYTRYADDITFSFDDRDRRKVTGMLSLARDIVQEFGYTLHGRRKLRILRRHHRQTVTGLVVNAQVNLPRHVRRRLRAIGHRLAVGKQATLTPDQFRGWQGILKMIEAQQ